MATIAKIMHGSTHLRRWAARWLARLSRWLPLTPLGLLAVPILIWLDRAYAVRRQDKIFLAACVCGLGLIVLQTAIVLFTALWLKLRRESGAGRLELETGVPLHTGRRLGLVRWNPLVKIEVEWLEPAGVAATFVPVGNGIVEEATASDRGVFSQIVRRDRISDIFGVSRFYVTRRVAQPIVVRPSGGKEVAGGPAFQPPPRTGAGSKGRRRDRDRVRQPGDRVDHAANTESFSGDDPVTAAVAAIHQRVLSPTARLTAIEVNSLDDSPAAIKVRQDSDKLMDAVRPK